MSQKKIWLVSDIIRQQWILYMKCMADVVTDYNAELQKVRYIYIVKGNKAALLGELSCETWLILKTKASVGETH